MKRIKNHGKLNANKAFSACRKSNAAFFGGAKRGLSVYII